MLPLHQGYGVYSWPNGDVFMGQWQDGVREGVGIFRSFNGREYMGSWANNVREGYGVSKSKVPSYVSVSMDGRGSLYSKGCIFIVTYLTLRRLP